jgi:hypothetical protein
VQKELTMKVFRLGLGTVAVLSIFAASVWACDKDKAGGCTKSATVASAEAKAPCHGQASEEAVDAAMARVFESMPKLVYRIGDAETICDRIAESMSADTKQPIVYVVAGETFNSRQEAMNKLAERINEKLDSVTHVAYLVGDETVQCPKAAAAAAEAKHAKAQPVLAGVKFDCPDHAQAVAAQLEAKMKEFRATTASAKATTGGCAKSGCSKGGCSKAAAAGATASTGGCSKAKEAGATASTGGCSKAKEAGAVATGGCSKSKDAATASADSKCCKLGCGVAVSPEDTPALANAKQMVRQVVEFVVAAQQHPAGQAS